MDPKADLFVDAAGTIEGPGRSGQVESQPWGADGVAVLSRGRRDRPVLELAAKAAEVQGTRLLVLVPRPSTWWQLGIVYSGQDPERFLREVVMSNRQSIRNILAEAAPELPYSVIELPRPLKTSAADAARAHKCSTLYAAAPRALVRLFQVGWCGRERSSRDHPQTSALDRRYVSLSGNREQFSQVIDTPGRVP